MLRGDFPDLPPGDYAVTAEAKGFSKQVVVHVALVVNAQQVVNFELNPARHPRPSFQRFARG